MTPVNTSESLSAAYHAGLPGSARLFAAGSPIAGEVSHDSWRVAPFAPVFTRAEGARKWDVDGRAYIDFWAGHGSLLLGHGHPAVTAALARQVTVGVHLGGTSDITQRWATQVREMMPSIERLRFTSSGTEATMLALRAARSFTGRPIVVRLDGHFHGWHDEAMAHLVPASTGGINLAAEDSVRISSPFDLEAVEEELASGDVAAVILEPGGGSGGILPFDAQFLRGLRRLTERAGTVLIFDEVMSGFRLAPGGAQSLVGVHPDLTVLAKVLCGGLPGAAIGGRSEVMAVFGDGVRRSHGRARVVHTGTFNGCALSAAAGVATLELVADGEAQRTAAAGADRVVRSIREAADDAGVDVRAFARHSIFHLMIGSLAEQVPAEPSAAALLLQKRRPVQHAQLRLALLLEGIDCHSAHGWLSTAHDDQALTEAAGGFARAFQRLRGMDGFGAP